MRLIWSESFLSMTAIIDWMVLTTSTPMSCVCASACWASVCTASSTADFTSSDFGRNSFCSSVANSLPSNCTPARADGCVAVAVAVVARLTGRGERLEQRRILQDFPNQFFGRALAVHVGDQVGELLACLEQ